MIIRVDNDRDGYAKLFKDAYDLLVSEGRIEENEAGRLTSLEEFFSHIQDIVQLDDRYLIRLPIEEPTLKIDANKRTIDTSVFNNCITVQSDQIAEILVFSIDRYFDYKDLADKKVQIWVQWTAPAVGKGTVEGATYISLKDTETEPGKLRFGWPIDNEVTANPGTVQFAVRFFMKEDVEEYDKAGNLQVVNKVVYSLNTLPANMLVKSALQPNLNDDIAVNRPDGLFAYAVRNSLYAGKDVVLPQTPSFEAPGLQLPEEATLQNDTLTLKAQAVAGDSGTISYNWFYRPVDATAAINCGDENWGTIDMDYIPSTAKERMLNDDYYVEGEDLLTYELYTGKVKYDKEKKVLLTEDGRDLYEKYSTLTVPPTGDVTGTYTVKAYNTTTVAGKQYTSEPRQSRECVLVSPSEILIVQDLPNAALLGEKLDEEGDVVGVIPAELKITLAQVENDNTVFNYIWSRKDTLEGEFVQVASGEANKYNASEPGWYTVGMTASLNRQTNTDASDIVCKVTEDKAKAPVLKDADGEILEDNIIIDSADNEENVVLLVKAEVVRPEGKDLSLYSDLLTYKWYIQESEELERFLNADEIVGGAVNSETITVKQDPFGKQLSYRCVVTNQLNKTEASSSVLFRVN